MGNVAINVNCDFIAGLLRSQIGIAQNLQSSLENDQLDGALMKNDFQMLSRINRQIISCYERLEWPRARQREQLVD